RIRCGPSRRPSRCSTGPLRPLQRQLRTGSCRRRPLAAPQLHSGSGSLMVRTGSDTTRPIGCGQASPTNCLLLNKPPTAFLARHGTHASGGGGTHRSDKVVDLTSPARSAQLGRDRRRASAPGLVVVVTSPRPAGDAARTRDECYITYVRRGTRPAARTGPRRPSPPRSPPAAAAWGPDGYDGRPDPRRTGTPTLRG